MEWVGRYRWWMNDPIKMCRLNRWYKKSTDYMDEKYQRLRERERREEINRLKKYIQKENAVH